MTEKEEEENAEKVVGRARKWRPREQVESKEKMEEERGEER